MRILSHAEDAECAEVHLLRLCSSGVLVFLTTDGTDYTDASLAECEFCLTQRTQNAQKHASFLLRVASGVLVFLTTDYTDYTDSSLTVPSRVQRATICFICAISVLSVDKKELCHSWAIH